MDLLCRGLQIPLSDTVLWWYGTKFVAFDMGIIITGLYKTGLKFKNQIHKHSPAYK